MFRRQKPIVWLLGAAAWLAGCAVNPLTPTPVPTATLPPAVVVMVVITSSPTPQPTLSPAPETPITIEPTEFKFGEAPQPTATAAVASGGGRGGELAPTREPAGEGVSDKPAPTPVPIVLVAPPPAEDVAAAEQYCIDLINAQRAAAGLGAYARDETVMGIARARVADMVARGYRGHFDPVTGASLGRQMLNAAGFRLAGENWYGHRSGPVAIVDAAMAWFMTDPPHTQGILSASFTLVGVGIAHNGTQWLLVQNFAGN